jgi:hypothetical protein
VAADDTRSKHSASKVSMTVMAQVMTVCEEPTITWWDQLP